MTTRFIYCHPLFDERKCAHRFSYRLAQAFADRGLELERFDYRGTGEGAGEFEDVTMDSLRRDVTEYVKGDDVNLIGVRVGGSLAFDYCMRSGGQVRKLVLIEPVVDGAGYVDYLCRKQRIKDVMTGQSDIAPSDNGFVNIEGFKTNRRLIEQVRQLSLSSVAAEQSAMPDIFIARIGQSTADVSSFAGSLNVSVRRMAVESFRLPAFWERIPEADYSALTNRIAEWCND